ncbi:MAG: flavodoxin-dependent (E)-4-hydroxy-3-methylbut-2-enyl-diphosphate synthase [Ruminococcaceae bacterium]|nr:flavodoxin-dependent (E)-4-hydroxy-3-methylbut-2-enyl-diphosphate synthase [Oscillospiraceae bacterium]
MNNKKTRVVKARDILIGGSNPISVQSMTNKPALDFDASIEQILRLESAGCDIVRLAVPSSDAAQVFSLAKERGVKCALVADIHFDYKIALECVKMGADKIRINPGNIGESWKVREVADACRSAGLPIRIGVNGGSLDKNLLKKYGAPTAEALAESAMTEADVLESCGFSDIVLSIKSSTIKEMTRAARIVRENTDYPLHLGVTEAGDDYSGLVKNAVGIGSLLLDGIGDTIRVSLTADPVEEVKAGREILSSLGLNTRGGVEIISCPTCGRTKIDLIGIGKQYKQAIEGIDPHGKKLKVAVMGCVVNGPGEAREADFGIAGGDGFVLYFKNGEPQFKVEEERAVEFLVEETKKAILD